MNRLNATTQRLVDEQANKKISEAIASFQEDAIQARINQSVLAALRTVEITITVTKFVPVLAAIGKRQTPHTMAMLEQDESKRVWITGGKIIHIRPGGATLRFRIVNGNPKDDTTFLPLGIAFERKGDKISTRDSADRIGELNGFQSKIVPSEDCIEVTDNYKDPEHDDFFEFSIVIQNRVTGQIGIIDPGIDHEPI